MHCETTLTLVPNVAGIGNLQNYKLVNISGVPVTVEKLYLCVAHSGYLFEPCSLFID